MKIDAKLSINRIRYSDGDDKIEIIIEDEQASVRITTVSVDLAIFAKCITGLSYMPCKAELYNPVNLGKTKEIMTVKILLPRNTTYINRKQKALKHAQIYIDNIKDDWCISDNLESKNSFIYENEKIYCNIRLVKWTESNKNEYPNHTRENTL